MKEPKKEMSDEELREFWKNYRPPASDFAEALVTNLKAGILKQQRADEEARKRNQPPRL